MKKMDDELMKKIAVAALAIFSFVAVTFIFYSQDKRLEEVSLQEVAVISQKDKNPDVDKTTRSIEDFTGKKYVCNDGQFIFVDIYASSGGYKADVAVANDDGQYGMAYLTEVIGVGKEKKFEDDYNNYLLLVEDEAKVYVNDILIAEGCVVR